MAYNFPKTGAQIEAIHTKVDGVEAGAEVNNVSDVNAGDLTDAGDSTLHFHAADRSMGNAVETATKKVLTGTERAAIVANTAKDENATHTGEVTGSGVLTLDKTAVTGKTLVTAVGTDHVLIVDASDSDNLKKALISDFAGTGGGAIDWANPVAINTATALTIGKHHVISDLGTPADYTVTLPAVAGNAGKLISWEIAAAATKMVTVDGNAAETIDGELTRVMWAKETAILSCNGTAWTKVSGKSIPMSFSVYQNGDRTGLTSGWAQAHLDTEFEDIGGVFDTINYRLVPRRNSRWKLGMLGTVSSSAILQSSSAIRVDGNSADRLLLSATVTVLAAAGMTQNAGNAYGLTKELLTTEFYDLYAFASTGGPTFILNGTLIGSAAQTTMNGVEELTW